MAGTGLLLLRLAVGLTLLAQGWAAVSTQGTSSPLTRGLAVAVFLSGGAMVVGFLTPGAGVVAAVLGLGGMVLPGLAPSGGLEGKAAAALLIALSVAVALVGPGAFSVDARLFGRREIILPPASRRFPPH